jgi:hypothetical protein
VAGGSRSGGCLAQGAFASDELAWGGTIALVAGSVGSLALMLLAGRSTPRLLLAGFVLWIVSPFAVLAWAANASSRWSPITRTTLDVVTLVITLVSLAIYGAVVWRSAGSPRGPAFVAVPPASWLLIAGARGIAALAARNRPSGGGA